MKAASRFLYFLQIIALLACGWLYFSRSPDRSEAKSEPLIIGYSPLETAVQGDYCDILGCDGFYVDSPTPGNQVQRHYYTQNGEVIATSWGFPGWGEDCVLDLNGDGVRELICNVVYGDGAERVVIYSISGGLRLIGTVDESFFDEKNAEYRSIRERYDPEAGVFIFSYAPADNPSERVFLQYDTLAVFTFTFCEYRQSQMIRL